MVGLLADFSVDTVSSFQAGGYTLCLRWQYAYSDLTIILPTLVYKLILYSDTLIFI